MYAHAAALLASRLAYFDRFGLSLVYSCVSSTSCVVSVSITSTVVFPLAAPTQFRYLLRYALGSCVFRLTVHVSGLLCGRVVVCRVLYRRGVLWPHFCLFYCCLVAAWLLLPEGVLCFSSSVFVGMGDAVSNGR